MVLVLIVVARLRRQTADRGAMPHQFTDDPHRRHAQFDPATGAIVGGLMVSESLQNQASDDAGSWGAMSDSSGSFDSGSSGSFDGGSASID